MKGRLKLCRLQGFRRPFYALKNIVIPLILSLSGFEFAQIMRSDGLVFISNCLPTTKPVLRQRR